jgi:type III secretion protein Q
VFCLLLFRGKIVSVQNDEFASIKVRVTFQVGQSEMEVGDLQGLAPGMVVTLNRGEEGDLVDILANGRKIGSGELVKAGDRFAVRVTKVRAND